MSYQECFAKIYHDLKGTRLAFVYSAAKGVPSLGWRFVDCPLADPMFRTLTARECLSVHCISSLMFGVAVATIPIFLCPLVTSSDERLQYANSC